jgi:hypothetical protein
VIAWVNESERPPVSTPGTLDSSRSHWQGPDDRELYMVDMTREPGDDSSITRLLHNSRVFIHRLAIET